MLKKKKVKILLVNNNTNACKIGIITNHILLSESNVDKYDVDIKYDYDLGYDYSKFTEYDYVVFHESIGVDYNKCRELLKYLKTTETKTVNYIDQYWNLPKEDSRKVQFTQLNLYQKLSECIKLSDIVLTYSENLFDLATHLNPNTYYLENVQRFELNEIIKVDNPTIAIIPSQSSDDVYNIKQLDGIHNILTNQYIKEKNIKFLLCGFDLKFMQDDKIYPPEKTFFGQYENIITNNYKMVSKKYKEFLLKFIPNKYYNGNVEEEPYKRIWKSEFNEDILCYNILLRPLKNNEYNISNYDYLLNKVQYSSTKEYPLVGISTKDTKGNFIGKKNGKLIKSIIESNLRYNPQYNRNNNVIELLGSIYT